MSEWGPFSDERQAMSTRAAARIRAAFDAAPGVGASVPESLKVMADEAGACGVELGALDLITLKGIAWREAYETVCVAGMIRRAFEAGKAAALAGAETRWAVRSGKYVSPCGTEGEARDFVALVDDPPGSAVSEVVSCLMTPWTPVPGEEGEG